MHRVFDPRRVARRRVMALMQQLPLAMAGEADGVHDARVASRRLRELVPLLAAGAEAPHDGDVLRKHVRRVTRALGPVRELDVACARLDWIGRTHDGYREAAARARDVLARERAAAADALEGLGRRVDTAHVVALTAELALACTPPAARARLASALAARTRDRAQHAAQAILEAGTVYAADRLHRTRIALKRCRYVFELADVCAGFRLAGTLRRLKRAQDTLGEMHDNDVLAGRVRDCAAGASRRRARGLIVLADWLDGQVRQSHSDFLRERLTLDAVLARASVVAAALDHLAARTVSAP